MLRFAAVTLLACACALPAAAESVRISATTPIAGDALHAGHHLPLHLYLFSGSRWVAEDIVRALSEAAPLLAQCDIAIAPAELHTVDAPRRYLSYSTALARELLRALPVAKPAIFFVDETLNRPAYDAETVGLANARKRPELAHTIWVAYGARDLPVALAHELVHLLSNSGAHSDAPSNLMREDSARDNTRLTSEQCARARAAGLAQRLLVKSR